MIGRTVTGLGTARAAPVPLELEPVPYAWRDPARIGAARIAELAARDARLAELQQTMNEDAKADQRDAASARNYAARTAPR